jgi:pyruvate/2-oxoglutarate dehydrogenase complex dihydrolipoamide acyltransferase (E2) component
VPDERSHILNYPSNRQFIFDIGRLGSQKHYVRGLVEVDVTEALRRIKELRAPGRKLTLFSWLVKVAAETVVQHPPINGVRLAGNRILVYDDVDVSLTIEKVINGVAVPLPLTVRKANLKSAFEINDEIQAAKDQAVDDEGNYVLGQKQDTFFMKLAAALPQWIRLIYWRKVILGERMQSIMGSMMITSVGMVGSINGWIMPTGIHPVLLAMGSINKKEVLRDGEVQKRDILHLTISVDHDIVDGIPAAMFCDDLVKRLESAEGLG